MWLTMDFIDLQTWRHCCFRALRHSQMSQEGTDIHRRFNTEQTGIVFLNQLPRTCDQREFYFCVIRAQVMSSDFEEQEDELLALQSIFSPQEFGRNESKVGGEIRVCVDLPAGFTVATKEGELKIKLRNLFLFVKNKPMVELGSDFQAIFNAECQNDGKDNWRLGLNVVLFCFFPSGDLLCQYEISFLPPLLLNFDLPEDYPSSSPPSFTLTCSWLSHTQVILNLYYLWHSQMEIVRVLLLQRFNRDYISNVCRLLPQISVLAAQLIDIYQATRGTVVLFTWVQFLKEDALRFLDIENLLELPSDDHISKNCCHAANQQPDNHPAPDAGTSHNVSCDLSGHCEGDVSAPSDLSASAPSEPRPDHASLSKSHGNSNSQEEDQSISLPFLSPSQRLVSEILINDATQQQKRFASTVFDCGVCFTGYLGSDCVKLPECGHIFCRGCLSEFCKVLITEGNVRGVTCPQGDCSSAPTPAQVRASLFVIGSLFYISVYTVVTRWLVTLVLWQVRTLVGEELFGRYDRLLLQNTLERMSGTYTAPLLPWSFINALCRWVLRCRFFYCFVHFLLDVVYCPRRDCGSAVIREKSSNAAMCSVCGFAFCVACRKTYHGAGSCRPEISLDTENETEEGKLPLPKSKGTHEYFILQLCLSGLQMLRTLNV